MGGQGKFLIGRSVPSSFIATKSLFRTSWLARAGVWPAEHALYIPLPPIHELRS